MKAFIARSSDLFRHDRWDVGFHALNMEFRDQASALSMTMSAEEALEILSNPHSMPTTALKLIAPLVRGQGDTPNREQLLRAAKEYPFLALAIVRDKGVALINAHKDELEQQARQLTAASEKLSSTGPRIAGIEPIPNHIRTATEKNAFVGGVIYFDGDTLAIPAETSPTAYVADCWVIELSEWTGPQCLEALVNEGNVPVPRRREDLGTPVGVLPDDMPDHTVNYGLGWGPRDRQ